MNSTGVSSSTASSSGAGSMPCSSGAGATTTVLLPPLLPSSFDVEQVSVLASTTTTASVLASTTTATGTETATGTGAEDLLGAINGGNSDKERIGLVLAVAAGKTGCFATRICLNQQLLPFLQPGPTHTRVTRVTPGMRTCF